MGENPERESRGTSKVRAAQWPNTRDASHGPGRGLRAPLLLGPKWGPETLGESLKVLHQMFTKHLSLGGTNITLSLCVCTLLFSLNYKMDMNLLCQNFFLTFEKESTFQSKEYREEIWCYWTKNGLHCLGLRQCFRRRPFLLAGFIFPDKHTYFKEAFSSVKLIQAK